MPTNNPPVTITAAIAAVLTSGVALLAIFLPGLTDAAQIAIVAFGNSVIILGALLYTLSRSTSTTAPVVPVGTDVTVITAPNQPNRLVTLHESSGVPIVESKAA